MQRTFGILGAVLAFLSVAGGAFAAHGLEGRLAVEALEWFELAMRYGMYHALATLLVAVVLARRPGRAARVAGTAFVAGVLVFSGTLVAMALGAPRALGAITPVGGTFFLVGWAALAAAAARAPDPVGPGAAR